ncbi:phosphodiester glycosidase family protein [Galactobacillus timonensis]|uniref:phosphodiester glycosidase family protein n=1 Tax=Galactobacillus timonensis TaxID=2041840 RepID=UPI000C8400CA|nr:phosphodiester glycosidase family protein [Galactobacillus timonensis]
MSNQKKKGKKKKVHLKTRLKRFGHQTLILILVEALTLGLTGYIALLIVLKGPSQTFSDMVVTTMWETRRGRAVINFMFTDEEIQQMLSKNQVISVDANVSDDDTTEFNIPEDEKDDLEIIDIQGSTYKGKLMIVRDPSRIDLGVNLLMEDPTQGYSVLDYVQADGAVAGINAGGFDDPNGQGDGSIPQGIVIKDGQLVAGTETTWGTVAGFNAEHHLIAGDMTGAQALEWGLVDAVTFGPVLVYDGHALPITGTGGGINPRTVIGQRADGAVLLLIIDGRQPNSLGATYANCQDLMLQYGAVVAVNLDGGSSSIMVYNGEIINSIVSMNSDRSVPTAWLVK